MTEQVNELISQAALKRIKEGTEDDFQYEDAYDVPEFKKLPWLERMKVRILITLMIWFDAP